jgi:GNAT superfamily N-acetyltransferase
MTMPTLAGVTRDQVSSQAARRWQGIDPLLPAPWAGPGCGAELVVTGSGDQPVAVGICGHWKGRPGSLELTWGATRRFRLVAQAAGPDVAGAMDKLLLLWRDHLAGMPAAAGDDTAAVINWPSRDIEGIGALLRHGLAPLTVLAARPAGRGVAGPPGRAAHPAAPDGNGAVPDGSSAAANGNGAGPATWPPGIRIRRARPGDLDAVVRMGMEIVRFDAHFGCVTERPGTADALRREATRLLAGPSPWTWLAECDGEPVGMVQAERPERAAWIAPMVGRAPAAYLGQTFVVPDERGSGVAAALVAQLHREVDAAGVAVTLLHYEQVNPLSGPFWGRQGYRPLWITWEARPARALR